MDGYPVVATQPLVELTPTHVDRHDGYSTPLQQAVGEATCTGADIHRTATDDLYREPGQRRIQFLATATHEPLCRLRDHDGLGGRNLTRRLVGRRPVHGDAP